MREGTDRHTDKQIAMANIQFTLAMPHAKCNEDDFSIVCIVHLTLWSNFCVQLLLLMVADGGLICYSATATGRIRLFFNRINRSN